jgi:hypothetical protein
MPSFLMPWVRVSVARLTATQEAGAASEMPCAAPPTRVYPAGMVAAGLGVAARLGVAAGLPDAALEADGEPEAASFAAPGALPHAVTVSPIPITTGIVEFRNLMRIFATLRRKLR